MRSFADATPFLRDPELLRRQLTEEGYLFLPGLLPAAAVDRVREELLRILTDCRWLAGGAPAEDLRPGPNAVGEAQGSGYFGMYTALQSTQAFHELAVRPELTGVAAAVFGEEVVAQPLRIARVALPDGGAFRTRPHQDIRFIQGTFDVLTAWLPLAPCPTEVGGLSVLAGDPSAVLPVERAPGPGGLSVGIPPDDSRWRYGEYAVGDVLLFRSVTVHASQPNRSDRLRLSADFRYQPVADPISTVAVHPHYFPTTPDWPTLTRGWSSGSSVAVPATMKIVESVPADAERIDARPTRFAPAS